MRLSKFSLVACLFCSLVLVPALGWAQGFWVKKDFRSWTEKECRKMLEDSPWAKTRTIGRAVIEELSVRSMERAREDAPRVEYRVQIRSAQPLRQALVRLQQLNAGFEKLPADKQQAFNAQGEKFLAAQFPDTIVFYVEYSTNTPGYARDLAYFWRTQTVELLQKDVRLYVPREQSQLPAKFIHTGGEATAFQLVFPRPASLLANPVMKDDEIKIEFQHPTVGQVPGERVFLVFKVKDMVLNGMPTY